MTNSPASSDLCQIAPAASNDDIIPHQAHLVLDLAAETATQVSSSGTHADDLVMVAMYLCQPMGGLSTAFM